MKSLELHSGNSRSNFIGFTWQWRCFKVVPFLKALCEDCWESLEWWKPLIQPSWLDPTNNDGRVSFHFYRRWCRRTFLTVRVLPSMVFEVDGCYCVMYIPSAWLTLIFPFFLNNLVVGNLKVSTKTSDDVVETPDVVNVSLILIYYTLSKIWKEKYQYQ